MRRKSTDTEAASLDSKLLEALLDGDESAFGTLVQRYNRAMVRLAMAYVPSRAVAEEVAQEAWLGMFVGLSRFRGSSSLKTWLFGILLNRAKTRGSRESRSVAFSNLGPKSDSSDGAEQLARLGRGRSARLTVAWQRAMRGWTPEDRLLSGELRLCLERAMAVLPPSQRAVIVLRDVEGWSSGEVCELLGITPENQRVRLHRARLRVREAVERYLEEGEGR